MSSIVVSKKFAVLQADGGANGLATLSSNEGWLPKAIVHLAASTQESLECEIMEQVGSTQVRLRLASSDFRGPVNISAYTLARTASLAMETQAVAVRGVFEPFEKA